MLRESIDLVLRKSSQLGVTMKRRTLLTIAATPLINTLCRASNAIESDGRSIFEYGARGDGTADDSAAFKLAAEDVRLGKVGQLILPPGQYLIGRESLLFEGGGASLVFCATQKGSATIKIDNSQNNPRPIIFRNFRNGLYIEGINFVDGHNYNGHGKVHNLVDIQNCQKVLVENCSFVGASFYGLGIYESTRKGDPPLPCDDLVIRHNFFRGIGVIALEVFPKVTSESCEIYENMFIGCGGNWEKIISQGKEIASSSTCAMKPGQSFRRARIYKNRIEDCAGGGIYLANIESLTCYSNTLSNIGVDARSSRASSISITIAPHRLGYRGAFEHVEIKENYISWDAPYPANHAAIQVNGGGMEKAGPIIITHNHIGGKIPAFHMKMRDPPEASVSFRENRLEVASNKPPIFLELGKLGHPSRKLDISVARNVFLSKQRENRYPLVRKLNHGGVKKISITENSVHGTATKIVDVEGGAESITVDKNSFYQ